MNYEWAIERLSRSTSACVSARVSEQVHTSSSASAGSSLLTRELILDTKFIIWFLFFFTKLPGTDRDMHEGRTGEKAALFFE